MVSRKTSSLTLLLLGLAFVYANSLFNHGLIPSMEPRFARVITEMMAAGQFLVPIKNGIPYVEYPPLLYWLAIIPAKLGMPVEAAIRLPCSSPVF
jgi:4-amino-4-deoxy-L-arabinose transferase-like glycosyltransferase